MAKNSHAVNSALENQKGTKSATQPLQGPLLIAEVDEDVILARIIEGFCRLQWTLHTGVLQPIPCKRQSHT